MNDTVEGGKSIGEMLDATVPPDSTGGSYSLTLNKNSKEEELTVKSYSAAEDLLDVTNELEDHHATATITDGADRVLLGTTPIKEEDIECAPVLAHSSLNEAANDGPEDEGTCPSAVTMITTTVPTSPTPAVQQLRTGKRPSPWREPRTTGRPPPPARETNHHNSTNTTINRKSSVNQDEEDEARQWKRELKIKKKKERRLKYLCSGSIIVDIPLTVTADLGIALRRGREHRIRALYRHFPSLQQQLEPVDGGNERTGSTSDTGIATMDESHGKKGDDKAVPKKILRHVPQPHEYANVIDYLEAKYVQGVVISDDLQDHDDETGGNVEDDDEEGQGSVYSETSFLDDTGLQRTIAEQVLGHTTTTKLELMDNEDGGFFVNVGDLEVEETDLTQDMYDPLHDTKKDSLKKNKNSRKRKKSNTEGDSVVVAAKKSTNPTNDKINKNTNPVAKQVSIETISSATTKTVKSITPTANKKIKMDEKKPDISSSSSPKTKKEKVESVIHKNPVTLKLQKIASRKKEEIMEHYGKLKVIIDNLTDEELPRKPKPKRTRVVVKVPSGNQPGDTITFANPHVPGQKLKVKVPANVKAGETFKVTVPKPAEEENDDDKLGEDGLARDHNKFNRDFYDVLDDYAKAYDEWCDAEGAYRRAIDDKTFTSHFMKRNKCDDLIPLFPNDTKTSISIEYLKKVIRRARQNKHKRELTLAKQQITFIEEHQDLIEQDSDDNDGSAGEDNDEDDGEDDNNNDGTQNNNNPNSSDDDEKAGNRTMHGSIKTTNPSKVAVTKKGAKPTRTAILPDFSSAYPIIPFRVKDFTEV